MGVPSFKNGKMFVGWRHRDWKFVYYEPYIGAGVEADDNGLTPSLYYVNDKGEEEEPMTEGEVLFLPYFALDMCETKGKAERKAMQCRNLKAAWKLYNENDPVTFKEAMEAAADPAWGRWAAIMKDIKLHKRPLMKAKETRRKKRVANVALLRRAGVPENELDNHLSSEDSDSDSDSGYDEDDDKDDCLIHSRSSKPGPMNPPSKRPGGSGSNNPRLTKKNRTAPRQQSEDLMMTSGRQDSADFDLSPPERNSGLSSSERDSGRSDDVSDRQPVSTTESNTERRGRLGGYMQPTFEDDDVNAMNGSLNEDDAFQKAMRDSQQPEDRQTQEYVAPTTEDDEGDDDDDVLYTGNVSGSSSSPSASGRAKSGSLYSSK